MLDYNYCVDIKSEPIECISVIRPVNGIVTLYVPEYHDGDHWHYAGKRQTHFVTKASAKRALEWRHNLPEVYKDKLRIRVVKYKLDNESIEMYN